MSVLLRCVCESPLRSHQILGWGQTEESRDLWCKLTMGADMGACQKPSRLDQGRQSHRNRALCVTPPSHHARRRAKCSCCLHALSEKMGNRMESSLNLTGILLVRMLVMIFINSFTQTLRFVPINQPAACLSVTAQMAWGQ